MQAGFTQQQLRQRGWTLRVIAQYLDPPDRIGTNRAGRPFKIYSGLRVAAAERRPEVAEIIAASRARRARKAGARPEPGADDQRASRSSMSWLSSR